MILIVEGSVLLVGLFLVLVMVGVVALVAVVVDALPVLLTFVDDLLQHIHVPHLPVLFENTHCSSPLQLLFLFDLLDQLLVVLLFELGLALLLLPFVERSPLFPGGYHGDLQVPLTV